MNKLIVFVVAFIATTGLADQYIRLAGGGTASGVSIGDVVTGGTAGSVLFIDGGAALDQDNANFFYDVTNHRLGLGTTTPGKPLDVNGAAHINGTITGASSGDWVIMNGVAGTDMLLEDGAGNEELRVKHGSSGGARVTGDFIVLGSLQTNTAAAKPTCDATHRGTLYVEQGGGGVTDTFYACLKAAAGTYSWVSIVTGG